jgi:hypothetical protein
MKFIAAVVEADGLPEDLLVRERGHGQRRHGDF